MTRPKKLHVVMVGLLTSIGTSAAAQTVATRPDMEVPAECTFSQPARVAAALKDLPEVAAEFTRLGVDIADVGEPFISFDVEDEASRGLPHRQFLRAYVFADLTIVWYYHGGFGTHAHVIELQMRRDTNEPGPILRVTGRNLGGPLCRTTQAMLDGVHGNSDW